MAPWPHIYSRPWLPHYLVPQISDPTPLTLTCSWASFSKKTQSPLGYALGSPSEGLLDTLGIP